MRGETITSANEPIFLGTDVALVSTVMNPDQTWPTELLDSFDHAVAVVDSANTVVYANREARRLLDIGPLGTPVEACPAAAAIAARVRANAAPTHDLEVLPAEGKAWRGHAWPMFGGAIAFAIREQAKLERVEVLEADLGIGRRDAQLALDVTDGKSNKSIADALRIPLGTVATRLSRLYRRSGVQNRAELAALVTSKLDAAGRA